jgi:hypothetical protein
MHGEQHDGQPDSVTAHPGPAKLPRRQPLGLATTGCWDTIQHRRAAVPIRYAIWDTEHDPRGNVQHVAEHGLTPGDVKDVLFGIHELDQSDASGSPIAFGFTSAGEYICVVFDWVDDDTVYPVTAYPVEE